MPHLFPFANSSNHAPDGEMHHLSASESSNQQQEQPPRKRSAPVLRTFHRIGDWLRRDEDEQPHAQRLKEEQQSSPPPNPGDNSPGQDNAALPQRGGSLLGRTLSKSRRVVPELPRQFTFKRQESEKRERLMPIEPSIVERRTMSADRRPREASKRRRRSPSPSRSAPDIRNPVFSEPTCASDNLEGDYFDHNAARLHQDDSYRGLLPELPPFVPLNSEPEGFDDRALQAELEAKWVLNLSMHFRDKSDREKFFVTYAQEPNQWRRVTVSCDYRDAPLDSLEADLKSLRYQRDKSQRIYEAIRESLPEIQFYDTVTNLKLETEEGRLHVHVTEDVNEVIAYPPSSLVEHVNCDRYRESDLEFQSHLSGFVYKVSVDNRIFIKKEIPGPDTIDEFLYEVNALDSLRDSKSVIQFHGLVVDEAGESVKGLLIAFASLGALVDIIYDYKSTDSLPWSRREKWAYQVTQGLSEIHEAGFVQGDFTLSNIVIDSDDDAKIIDINRRGCPIGWEPPELLRLIRSGQRISMCIGVKSDLFQLGMVLWALAENHDEPERIERTNSQMPRVTSPDVPGWSRNAIDRCLSKEPRDRPSAKELLLMFSDHVDLDGKQGDFETSNHSFASHRSSNEFVDPSTIVNRDDIDEFKRRQGNLNVVHRLRPLTGQSQPGDPATSTGYRIENESNGSYILPRRGRSPYIYHRSIGATSVSSTTSISLSQGRGLRLEQLCPEVMSGFEHEHEVFPDHNNSDIEQRPLVPDAPPFRDRAPERVQEMDSVKEHTTKPISSVRDESQIHSQHRYVSFNPPMHQDSGFDENMIEALENGGFLSQLPQQQQQQHANLLRRDLPPILTTSVEGPNKDDQPTPALAQAPESLMSPTGLTYSRDSHTPQSPPTPATPFSYHTPLASPLDTQSGLQEANQSFGKPAHGPERPDSKICPNSMLYDTF